MRTAAQFEAALHADQPWKTAYPVIEAEAKALLDNERSGVNYTTTEFAELLYSGTNEQTWERLFKGLKACADHGLKPYTSKGEVEKIGAGTGRRTYWHAKRDACEACGRPL